MQGPWCRALSPLVIWNNSQTYELKLKRQVFTYFSPRIPPSPKHLGIRTKASRELERKKASWELQSIKHKPIIKQEIRTLCF